MPASNCDCGRAPAASAKVVEHASVVGTLEGFPVGGCDFVGTGNGAIVLVGGAVGLRVGTTDGLSAVGFAVGPSRVGDGVGGKLGTGVGKEWVGHILGLGVVGTGVGVPLGADGSIVGSLEGEEVGKAVGTSVGIGDGMVGLCEGTGLTEGAGVLAASNST